MMKMGSEGEGKREEVISEEVQCSAVLCSTHLLPVPVLQSASPA
jgi:hypothetical protein